MRELRRSVAFRLALLCGLLIVGAVVVLSVVFYGGTVVALRREADLKISVISERLAAGYADGGTARMVGQIRLALADGVDSDTEVYLLESADGRFLAGNLAAWSDETTPLDRVLDHAVVRAGRPSHSRVLLHRPPDGSLLVVGRDMADLERIGALELRAIVLGGLLALALAVVGAVMLRRRIEQRVSAISTAAHDIAIGNLSRRIELSAEPDEFDRLGGDINRMLDRIEHLMDGVRQVSNAVAHNLRTPLGRIRGGLEEGLRHQGDTASLGLAAQGAIEQIDELTGVVGKLLQIAEAESGTRREPFGPVDLCALASELLELYDAAAEEQGARLRLEAPPQLRVQGDRQLLASCLDNLLDNALKYAGRAATVVVRIAAVQQWAQLEVEDNGPGMPAADLPRATERFYRGAQPGQGNGLGLAIVAAIVRLHEGELEIEDAAPGLRVRMRLRGLPPASFPDGNVAAIPRKGGPA